MLSGGAVHSARAAFFPNCSIPVGRRKLNHIWGGHSMNSIVTIHGALHPAAGHPADNFTVSDIQPLAEGDLEWAGCVTVCGWPGREPMSLS